ncbi:MAG: lipoyl(octanoyl) transferase LipB [Balneolaceae bacterium]
MKRASETERPEIEVYDLEQIDYQAAWELQKQIQKRLIDEKLRVRREEGYRSTARDVLLLVEHPHVFTLGKSGDASHLLRSDDELEALGAQYVPIDRGGDITYHGPGQLVGYPILDLDRYMTDIHKYLRSLEEVIIRVCADFGVQAGRTEGLTGVWVGDQKICAMGIRCSRWVTMHGFALNLNSDLTYFGHIVPCGIQDRGVANLSDLAGRSLERREVTERLLVHFAEVFNGRVQSGTNLTEIDGHYSYL